MPSPKLLLLLVLCYSTFPLSAQDKAPFTSMDVFDLEWVTAPNISPNGDWIVYQRRSMDIMKDRRTARLWLIRADGTEHRKLTSNDVSESAAVWSPDGTRRAFVSGSDQGSEIFVYWLASGTMARLTQLERSPSGLSWSPDGKHIAFSMLVPGQELKLTSGLRPPRGAEWAASPRITTRVKHEADGSGYMEPGFSHYFIIPAEGGSPRQVTSGNYNHRGAPQWTPDGKHLVFSANRIDDWEYRFRNSEVYSLEVASGDITPLTDRDGPDRSPAVSPDGKTILYLGYPDKMQTYQITRVYSMNLDGSGKKEIPLKLDRSVGDLTWSADGKGFYFQYDNEGSSLVAHATLDGKHTDLVKNVGGTSVARPYSGGSYSVSKGGKVAYTLTSPYHPAELSVQDGSGAPEQITHVSKSLLDYRKLGKLEEIWYKSSVDGRDIQGWVVYPPDFEESGSYPLMVENHGGPISSYGPHFSPEVQLYATAGYAVYYPNPRGSTSYGEEFGNLLYHNYPGEDYNDVMDGVDELLKRSYFSEDSLFVTGGSAGGIMTAWMIGKNNRFRSAAVIKPVMNWISKTLVADNYYGYAYSRYPGQPWENPMEYWKFSPISLVANVETPTLVMVGSADLRTPLSEAKQLYHALKLRKIETALVEVPGAYHFIANRPSQLITKIDHIVAWFNRYR
jgi:dipeptidyl aminopeptidase/acylaminoacyl peptidase